MRFSAVATIVLLSGVLTACQTLNAVTESVTGPSGTSETQKTPETAPTSVAPIGSTPVAARASGGLVGMTSDGLRAAWGEPSLKRTEMGAELWQYGGSTCTLLVYLYADPSNALTVSRAEAVPGGADEAALNACAKAAGKPSLKPIS